MTLQTERVQTLADVRAVIDGNDRAGLPVHRPRSRLRVHPPHAGAVRLPDPEQTRQGEVIGRYLAKMTGLSRGADDAFGRPAPSHRACDGPSRRARQCARSSAATPAPTSACWRRWTAALGDMSGPATRGASCAGEFEVFGQRRFERLARLSNGPLVQLAPVSHLPTQTHHVHQDPANAGRHWRAPQAPARRATRLPTRRHRSHRATSMVSKGVYHINTVDAAITQYEHIGCVQAISERFLLPVLEAEPPGVSLSRSRGIHTDNGSEYINQRCRAALPQQAAYRRVHQVPRPQVQRQRPSSRAKTPPSCANTSRYDHIPQRFSARVNAFTHDVLSPFLNHHRPCLFPHRTARPQRENQQTLPRPGHRHPL